MYEVVIEFLVFNTSHNDAVKLRILGILNYIFDVVVVATADDIIVIVVVGFTVAITVIVVVVVVDVAVVLFLLEEGTLFSLKYCSTMITRCIVNSCIFNLTIACHIVYL